MKKIGQRIAAMVMALLLVVTCVPEMNADAYNYSNFYAGETLMVTATDGVWMHTIPNVSVSNRITAIGYGNQVYVDAVYTSGTMAGWMKVTCGAHTGYVEGTEGWFTPYNATPTVYAYSNMQAKVLANALNVHSAPVKLSNNILDDLYYGQVVEAVGYTTTGWTKVTYYRNSTKITGYVYSAWVSVSAKASTTATSESFKKIYGYSAVVKSSCTALNVHVSPSTSADVITDLYAGDAVSIQAQSTHWYRVTVHVNGSTKTGYIYRSYTKKKDAMSNLRLSTSKKKKTVTTLTLKKGKTSQLVVRGNTGMTLKKTWKSSNKKVVKVNKYGKITAKKKGTAKITCTIKVGSRTKKLTCKIKVK